jgi:lipoprotein NlpI/transglutaminase-like putative cysteine protease
MTSFVAFARRACVVPYLCVFFASAVNAAPAKPSPIAPAAKGAAAAAAAKFSSQGFSYTVEKLPAWVDSPNPPTPSAGFTANEGWHYVMRDIQYRTDGKEIARHTNIIRRINSNAGLADGAKFSLDFEPSYHRLVFHEITIKRDGQTLNRLKPESISLLRREQQLENATYDGFVTAAVNVDDARVGDQIIYRYSIVGNNPVLKNRMSLLEPVRTFNPTDYMRVRTIMPKGRNLVTSGGVGLDRREAELPGNAVETVYAGRSLPAGEFRADGPAIQWIENALIATEFKDWQDVQAWGRELFDQPGGNADVAARAREIAARAGGDARRRVEAALQFVQQDIRYFSMSFGESSHRPAAPAKVLAQRFGDCKDKSLLLISLLREMGITAHPVLVSQSFRGDVDRWPAIHSAFDHAIVAVELDGTAYWVDATRAQQQGTLAERQAWSFGKGLVLNTAASGLTKAPPRPAGLVDQYTREEYIVSKLSEPVRLNVESVFTGEWAENTERIMSSPQRAQYEKTFFDYFTNRFDDAKVAVPFSSSGGLNGAAFVAKQSFDIENAFEMPERAPLTLTVGAWTMSATLNLGKDRTRSDAISLGIPRTVKHDISVKYSEDENRESFEKTQSVEDEHFKFTWWLVQSARENKINFQLDVRADRVEPAKLKSFQEKTREALEQIVFSVTAGVLTRAGFEKLKKEADALDRKNARGSRPATAVQRGAEVDLFVSQHKLDAGRLSPKSKSKVLRDRAIAYDYLGKTNDALREIAGAIALAPTEAAPRMTQASIQFGTGDFKASLASIAASESLRRDKSEDGMRRLRGRTRLYGGDVAGAAEDFKTSAQESLGAEKAYSVLWLYMSEWKRGNKDDAVAPLAKDVKLTEWPLPLVRFYRGEIGESELLKAAQDKNETTQMHQLCEAHFYIGQRYLRDGNTRDAMRAFKRARENDVFEFIEYRAAGFELDRLAKQ